MRARRAGEVRARAREAPARTGRAEERGARVRARDREDGRHHAVLDERARDDERDRHPGAVLRAVDQLLLRVVGIGARLHPRALGCALRVVEVVEDARRLQRLLERNVHVHVRVLVVDHNVLFSVCGGSGG